MKDPRCDHYGRTMMQPSRASIVFAVLAASRTLATAQPTDVPAVPPAAPPVAAPAAAPPAAAPPAAAPPAAAPPAAAPPAAAPPAPAPPAPAPPAPAPPAPAPPAPAPVATAPVATAPVAAPASGPGVAAAPTCAINIVRAPDGVRATIDGWIRAEPHCNVALEVRVIPTDHGLYVLARDDRGRSHERVVPDATSAGVLLSSWAADDSVVPPPPPPPQPPPVAIAPAPPPAVIAPPPVAPAPARVAIAAAIETAESPGLVARARSTSPTHWIGLSGLFGIGTSTERDIASTGGARLDATIGARGRWELGVAGTYVSGHHHPRDDYYYYTDSNPTTQLIDTSVVVHVGYAIGSDWLQIVPSLGAGVLYTRQRTPELVETISAVGEASVAAVLRIDHRVELTAGPIATAYSHRNVDPDIRRGVDLAMTGGLRWGW